MARSRAVKKEMDIGTACLFIASQRERKQWFDGKTTGWPCSITDNGDGTAIIMAPQAAFDNWDERNEYSSPCVYWP